MKKIVFLLIMLISSHAVTKAQVIDIDTMQSDTTRATQAYNNTQDNKGTTAAKSNAKETKKVKYDLPRRIVGLRGGANFANMSYSYEPIERYTQYGVTSGMIGLFSQLPLGQVFSLRPEVTFLSRGDSLSWKDVNYGITARYLDVRLPITMNIRRGKGNISPYLMIAPQLNIALNGQIGYSSDDTARMTIPLARSNMNIVDFSLLLGGGIDFTINTDLLPIYVSLEGGYNFGLVNNFSINEIIDNSDDPSIIANPFFGAELWHEKRYNRGVEVAVRVGFPLDKDFLKRYRERRKALPDTVVQLEIQTDTVVNSIFDTVVIMNEPRFRSAEAAYQTKECFTIAELYNLIEQGIDITGKRICMFDIKFDFDSYKIRSESEQPLNELVRMMWDYPQMTIEVYGHTDSIGTPEYNQKLSENRANAVVEYISNHGVSPSRVKSFGYGLRYPIDTNSTEEGRFRNRRVEFDVITIGIKRKYQK